MQTITVEVPIRSAMTPRCILPVTTAVARLHNPRITSGSRSDRQAAAGSDDGE
jgi:hypothetical protein